MPNTRVTLGKIMDGGKVWYNFQAGRPDLSADADATGAFAIEAPAGTYIISSPGGTPVDRIASRAERLAGAANIPLLIVVVAAGQNADLGRVQMIVPPGRAK